MVFAYASRTRNHPGQAPDPFRHQFRQAEIDDGRLPD